MLCKLLGSIRKLRLSLHLKACLVFDSEPEPIFKIAHWLEINALSYSEILCLCLYMCMLFISAVIWHFECVSPILNATSVNLHHAESIYSSNTEILPGSPAKAGRWSVSLGIPICCGWCEHHIHAYSNAWSGSRFSTLTFCFSVSITTQSFWPILSLSYIFYFVFLSTGWVCGRRVFKVLIIFMAARLLSYMINDLRRCCPMKLLSVAVFASFDIISSFS